MRRKDREVHDFKKIMDIINKAKILRLGLFDGDYPYIVPLHYGHLYDEKEDNHIFYMHTACEGHKLDLIQENPRVCIELDEDEEMVSGGEIPCRYGSYYSSVIGRGKVEIVENMEEKTKGLECLMFHQTEREFEIKDQMASSVKVLKVTVHEITAKERRKPEER